MVDLLLFYSTAIWKKVSFLFFFNCYNKSTCIFRSGHKVDNWKLYPAALVELGRVCKPRTGRAVLLTYDTKVMAHVSYQYCDFSLPELMILL